MVIFMTWICKYCGKEIEGVLPAPSTCWICYREIETDDSFKSNILFTDSGVYLRKVPVSKLSSLLEEILRKMDTDFTFDITTKGEFAEIFLSVDQLLYWAKKTFKDVVCDFLE